MLDDETPTTARYVPVPVADSAPGRLTVCLWDFSWYVRTGVGEPFEDLDRAAAETAARGYNTIRICAMPFLLFGSGIDTSEVSLDRLGGDYGQRVRWYDVKSPTVFDGRQQLLDLFGACRAHGLFVILSSWEYQQSSSFSATPDWWQALVSVDPEERAVALAESQSALIDFVDEHGYGDRILFTELHNEVQVGHLADGLPSWREDEVAALLAIEPRLSRGVRRFHQLQPARPVTVNYAHVPVEVMRAIPAEVDVAVFHPYVYGVLDEVTLAFDLRGSLTDFPRAAVDAAGLLRAGAPEADAWVLPPDSAWRMDATIVGKPEIFLHDWVDEQTFDRFLYERYALHRTEMDRVLKIWIAVAADFAASRGIPLVFGEGWVGYTPLRGTFEEGPVGAEFCRLAVRESKRVDAWGTIVCSNAAPHHPMWSDVALQRNCNDLFLSQP